jgi:hypothetical protein
MSGNSPGPNRAEAETYREIGVDSMSKPLNALVPEVLRWLAEREAEPSSAAEAEVAGPWKIVPLEEGGFGLFQLDESPEASDHPACTLTTFENALLAAAILPGTGRDPLYRLNPEETPKGFAIESEGQVVGTLPLYMPAVAEALHVVGCVLRSPAALARVLLAGSGPALERAGRALFTRLRPPSETPEPPSTPATGCCR